MGIASICIGGRLIDTLFFIYAGANVMAKRQSPIKPELSSALSQEHTP